MCSSQSVPQTRTPCVGRGGGETARTPERFTQAKALSSESFISEAKGRPRQTPPPGFSPNPAPRSRSWGARGSRIAGGRGSPGREEGWRSRDVEWELGGAWGRGLGERGGGGAGPRGPSPRLHRGPACYSARRSARTRAPPVAPGVGPRTTPPGPRATSKPGPETELELLSHPGRASPTVPPSGWTSGPWAPHRQGSGNPPRPTPRPSPARPSLQTPLPRLPSTPGPPLPIPFLPPSPSLAPGGREGGVRPAPSPPRPP